MLVRKISITGAMTDQMNECTGLKKQLGRAINSLQVNSYIYYTLS